MRLRPKFALSTTVRDKDASQAYRRVELIQYLIEHGEDVGLSTEDISYLLSELGEYIGWIRNLYKKIEGVPDYVMERKIRHQMGIVDFVLPEQLDRTSWEDLYDGKALEKCHERLRANNTNLHGSRYAVQQSSTLSWGKNLREEVTGFTNLFGSSNPWGIIPEVSRQGYRRCVFLDQEGRRCSKYTGHGVLCFNHKWAQKYLKGYLMTNGSTYSGMFKSTSLNDMYEKFMQSDARDLRGEIAIQRTMLASVVKKINEEMELDHVPFEMVEFISTLVGKISTTIKKYDDMQQKMGLLITPDQLNRIMMRMLELVRDTLNVSHEDFMLLANSFASLEFHQKDPASMLHLTKTVTVDHNYGADLPEGKPEVTYSSSTTRYLKGGGILDIDPQVEHEESINRQEHIAARYDATPSVKELPPADYPLPKTKVGGVQVPYVTSNQEVRDLNECKIGDLNDPFHVAGEI